MLKILQINSCVNGSTGTIMKSIQSYVNERGDSCITASRKDLSKLSITPPNHIFIGGLISKHLDNDLAYVTGKEGHYSALPTKNFLKKIDKYKPDVVHLHNLHANYINLEYLFRYLRDNNIKVIWTLHDCWAFTGHCPYYELEKCYKWKDGCFDCKVFREYPASKNDNSKYMYSEKKRFFTCLNNLTIVTPSKWLADVTKESFLQKYPIKIINNGIDTSVFYPRKEKVLKGKYNVDTNKIVVLGVASGWEERKGLKVFNKLAMELPEAYVIVLVGTNAAVRKEVSVNIKCIDRTENQEELANIYSEADIFVNPTMEENYPTVNIEAVCCGTPVVTYNTGGAGEIVKNGQGSIIPRGNYAELKQSIMNRSKKKLDNAIDLKVCEYYSKERMVKEYYELYLGKDTIDVK